MEPVLFDEEYGRGKNQIFKRIISTRDGALTVLQNNEWSQRRTEWVGTGKASSKR